jgi:hypothetical protein
VVHSFLVDDLTGGFGSRYEARSTLNGLIEEPLTKRDKEEVLRESWGMTPDAIASQEDSFWDS